MGIQIYDSLARQVVPLATREPGKVGMYVCGPTVYNFIHIGNARTLVWFELIRRYLRYRGFDVTYVMNYTDVDDKIIERANLENSTPGAIAEKYTKAFDDVMAALGVAPADILCRATAHIGDMVKAISGLIEKGFAYEADGNVFFAVEHFPGYGKLSGRSLDDMRAGERVEPHESKKSPLDFALWKTAKEGEPSWPSPWGDGRPGWHIECSVMSTKYLGMGFDIHGGGSDLIFPHHENEIAQAEALEGTEPFVRHWLHAGMVQMESEKMSKSLGNFVLANDVVQRYPRGAVRYWAVMGSYRTQVVFSEGSLADAQQSYERWKNFLYASGHALGDQTPRASDLTRPVGDEGIPEGYVQRFIDAMDGDFNTPQAFAVIHDLVGEANKLIEDAQAGDQRSLEDLATMTRTFLELTRVLGFTFEESTDSSQLVSELVEFLLELRDRARDEKEFDRADMIRARLTEMGISIEDTSSGTRWRLSDGA